MAYANQTFSSYPAFGATGGVKQEQTYLNGGGGASSTNTFRPQSGVQVPKPAPKQQITTTPQQPQQPQTFAAPKPPPPGVPTQAPSPATTSVRPPAPQTYVRPDPQLHEQLLQHKASSDPYTDPTSPPTRQPGWVWNGQRWVMQQSPTAVGMTPGGVTVTSTAGPGGLVQPTQGMPAAPAAPAPPPVQEFTPPTETGEPTMFNVEQLIAQLIADPARARREGAQQMFSRLTGEIADRVNEDAAARGLDFTSAPTSILADRTADLASQLQEQEAMASADDYVRALQLATAFGQAGQDNAFRNRTQALQEFLANHGVQQAGFGNEMALRDQDLQELLALSGLGQQDFQNQMALRNDLYRQLQLLMGLGGYAEDPLGLAVGSNFDYSDAIGQQAGGTADIFAQLAGLLPFLQGGGATPPITPGTPPITPGWQGTFGIEF